MAGDFHARSHARRTPIPRWARRNTVSGTALASRGFRDNLQITSGRCDERMEPRSQVWSDFSFVVSSGYREKVLVSLAPKPKLPMQLAEETNLRIVHVSRALRELSDRGLVACLTPDVKARGRLYGLTEIGAGLLGQMMVSLGRFSVPVAPAKAKPAAEPFVPKIRGSSVVRFLDYLRKVRGTRAVADAIRDWSVDPAGLTEDTWLSVES